MAKIADGVIVGSRLIQLLEEKDAPSKVRSFIRGLRDALSNNVENQQLIEVRKGGMPCSGQVSWKL